MVVLSYPSYSTGRINFESSTIQPIMNTPSSITAFQPTDIDQFALYFKAHRSWLGFSLEEAAKDIRLRNTQLDVSPKDLGRFERLELSYANMCQLMPVLFDWLQSKNVYYKLPQAPTLRAKPLCRSNLSRSTRVILEQYFLLDAHPALKARRELGRALNIAEKAVAQFFRNKRYRTKKKKSCNFWSC